MLSRRALVSGCFAAGLSGLVPALLPRRAQGTVSAPVESTRLGPNLWVVSGAGGNVVAGSASEGLLLVDGGSKERSAELLKRITADTGAHRVRTLFNTHWHWDHTGSNEALARSGATIVAHENTRLWLTAEVISKWENRTYPPSPARALPTQTFYYGTHELAFGNGKIEYGYLAQAHTDGDLYVFFPEANVLAAGDVVSGGSYPIADYCTNGWLGGMIQGLKVLLGKVDGETRVVPGSGPLRKKADLQAQLDLCYEVLAKIADSYYNGHTWEELLAAKPTQAFDATWGNPDVFLKTAYEGAWLHINEIRRVTR